MTHKQIITEFREKFDKDFLEMTKEVENDPSIGDSGFRTEYDDDKLTAWFESFLLSVLEKQEKGLKIELAKKFDALCAVNVYGECKYWSSDEFGAALGEDFAHDKFFPEQIKEALGLPKVDELNQTGGTK